MFARKRQMERFLVFTVESKGDCRYADMSAILKFHVHEKRAEWFGKL